MAQLLEYVGTIHIYLGPYRGNPIALYLRRLDGRCEIGPRVYPWNKIVGKGETPNKAAADFEEKWKATGLAPEMYSGPSWESGIKPERPLPPRTTASPPAPRSTPGGSSQPNSSDAAEPIPSTTQTGTGEHMCAPTPSRT